jgi:hypothetical protein
VKIRITTLEPRPDFRLVIAFLWGDGHNVDSDGNSYNPASREWTELYLSDRETTEPPVTVSPDQDSPLVLSVESDSTTLAARVAFFLASATHGRVAVDAEQPFTAPDVLIPHLGDDFDADAAFRRVAESPVNRATLENPYPNLTPTISERVKAALGL